MPKVITCGELLIDFVPTVTGVTLLEAPAFKKAPGGAPANVAVGLARLGVSSAFMGKVGDDAFGHFLAQILDENGVNTQGLVFSSEARTALAFISLKADGDRDFMFYRHPSADMLFRPDEIDQALIQSAQIFHFGSISLISEPSRSATRKALQIAHQAGLLVTYDPNLRLNLWSDESAARQGILEIWSQARVIKISREELVFLSGEEHLDAGVSKLWHSGLALLVVTDGRAGCWYFTSRFKGLVTSFSVEVVDTTGAGDGFVAGLLKGLIDYPNAWQDEAILQQICRYGNAVGALTTTHRGAIPALPYAQQVADFLQAQGA
jgi:fructokinase